MRLLSELPCIAHSLKDESAGKALPNDAEVQEMHYRSKPCVHPIAWPPLCPGALLVHAHGNCDRRRHHG